MRSKFFILCAVIFLVRLQGKLLIARGSERIGRQLATFFTSKLHIGTGFNFICARLSFYALQMSTAQGLKDLQAMANDPLAR